MATERERYELPPALAASAAGRGRSGFEDGFEPTDSAAVPSKGRGRSSDEVSAVSVVGQRCAGCGHDKWHHPVPLGLATTPCAWRGCGCPWFIYPTPKEALR